MPSGKGGTMAVRGGKIPALTASLLSQHPFVAPNIKREKYKSSLTRHKRRPVGLNDYSDHPCNISCITLKDRFIYVVHTTGFLRACYHEVFTPLRSWRGPPVA
ncbi:hypothetical protein SAMN05444266_103521 [Chitinophaga jiangningensis]|uniref:Uncharacterized protein n=2 Tax=Chitinophaga jiangningensis TaxID=1419482 RepID=A0A1M7B457_9BACT|nr:hypothetical protein SAMN05444266_103521 [Chitinophaga jiangningensis]